MLKRESVRRKRVSDVVVSVGMAWYSVYQPWDPLAGKVFFFLTLFIGFKLGIEIPTVKTGCRE